MGDWCVVPTAVRRVDVEPAGWKETCAPLTGRSAEHVLVEKYDRASTRLVLVTDDPKRIRAILKDSP